MVNWALLWVGLIDQIRPCWICGQLGPVISFRSLNYLLVSVLILIGSPLTHLYGGTMRSPLGSCGCFLQEWVGQILKEFSKGKGPFIGAVRAIEYIKTRI